jgi:hypothetical protein
MVVDFRAFQSRGLAYMAANPGILYLSPGIGERLPLIAQILELLRKCLLSPTKTTKK